MQVVYERYDRVLLENEYIPGFLAFREVPHLVALVEECRETHPEFLPQVYRIPRSSLFSIFPIDFTFTFFVCLYVFCFFTFASFFGSIIFPFSVHV